MSDVELPGRLGDPSRTLASDPRANPRLVAALAAFEFAGAGEPPPITAGSPITEILDYCLAAEQGFGAVFDALLADVEAVDGVSAETVTVAGRDGNEIALYVHRPTDANAPLPAVYHIHGGGMVINTAADLNYRHWRDTLAAKGLVVIGVEFRNGAGRLGPHPFPAGLNDCVDGLRWVLGHRSDLGVSHVVVSGESGGGNLTIATALSAKREGWIDDIAGVYAQCPYISGAYASPPPQLTSLHENDTYFLRSDMMAVLAHVYDPSGGHTTDPLAWPHHASVDELRGLPPHVVSVNELDPLRDEGLAYARRLAAAGVSVVSRTVNGTCHAGDLLVPGALPDVYAASARDVAGFVHSLS